MNRTYTTHEANAVINVDHRKVAVFARPGRLGTVVVFPVRDMGEATATFASMTNIRDNWRTNGWTVMLVERFEERRTS